MRKKLRKKEPSVTVVLDRVGRRLLRLLQSNGRLTNAELAKKVAVSPATCHRRTRHLFEDGYVRAVRAMVAPERVERGTLVVVGVVLDRSTPVFRRFRKSVAEGAGLPGVRGGDGRVRPFRHRQHAGHEGRKRKKGLQEILQALFGFGGVDGTRTRDPRRDRPVF